MRKRIKTYNEMKYLLKREMKRGRLLDVKRIPRQIGKTRLLKEIAESNMGHVVVSNYDLARLYNQRYCDSKSDIFISIREILLDRNKRYNLLLLDEGISIEDEKLIRDKYNVLGGFSSNYSNPNFQFETLIEEYLRTRNESILKYMK